MFYEFKVPDNLEDRLHHSALLQLQGHKDTNLSESITQIKGHILGRLVLVGVDKLGCDLFIKFILNLVLSYIVQPNERLECQPA